VTADHLEVGTRFADRVLVAASVGHLEPTLCINKLDLVEDRGVVEEVAARYERLGVPVHATSVVTGEGIDGLRELLARAWTAFTGHSGVGKSSLFNLLVPDVDQVVAEIGRFGGRHTTVAARAVPVPGLDAWLVDTPGVRSFGLGTLAPEELQAHFPELARLACGLDDCVHDGEPDCGLPAAVAAGDVHPARLDSYRRLLAALRGGAGGTP
jgi:ribosome biogenesis GTPase / thiamine phosphate phosphatase